MEHLKKTLAGLGICTDRFDEVMKAIKEDRFIPYERFEEVNRQKRQAEAERDSLMRQLEERDAASADAEALSARVDELNTLLEQQRADYDRRLMEKEEDLRRQLAEQSVKSALNAAGAKSHAAVRALLDVSALYGDTDASGDGFCERLDDALSQVREAHPYLFEDVGAPAGFRIGGETGGEAPAAKSAVASAFGN